MAKIFKNKQANNSMTNIYKSIFDDGKSLLFEKCVVPLDPSLIICQEIFFKKSKKKKKDQQNKLITLILTDEFLLFPKVNSLFINKTRTFVYEFFLG